MPPALLFDVHVHDGAYRRLQEEGLDVAHAADTELAGADDLDLLLAAAAEDRVVVTRNYRDFAPLVEALTEEGEAFAGVAFLSPAIRPSDLAGHVRAVRRWCERAGDSNPVEGSCGWISPA